MTDASASATTPASAGSSSAPAQPKVAAPKDRTCPYCHVSFTSSSLGRHLDLYIKEKNPKPPDGIHNVEEIRRSRGNITRRQARSSAAKRQQETVTRTAVQQGAKTDDIAPAIAQNGRKDGPYAFRQLFNTPHWTSTGVITDSDANSQLLNGDGMGVPSTPISQMDIAQRRKWMEERERGRAAELALQEIIESIKAATTDSSIPEPYDFDYLSRSFPQLCLFILPSPMSIDRPTLIPDPDSWPLDPPGQEAYEVLRRKIRDHLREWREKYYPPKSRKRRRESDLQPANGADSNGNTCANIDADTLEPNPLYQAHLTSAYNAWAALSFTQKAHDWHLSGLRAYARERWEHRRTKQRLEEMSTELNRARIDNARLTECQMPREWLHTPATQLPIAKIAAERVERELRKDGLDSERLIEKWRPRVAAARNLTRGHNNEEDREFGTLLMVGPAGGLTSESEQRRNVNLQVGYEDRIRGGEDDEEVEDNDLEDEEGESSALDEEAEYDQTVGLDARPTKAPRLSERAGGV